ncbi:MAG: DNA polymerase IV [Bacilli bacterium]
MEKIVFHIDVNNAFLSWTAIKLLNEGYKTDIRTISAIIGGDEQARSGIVLAKSIPAKKKGITTAETLYQARKKDKNLKIFPPDYEWYEYNSNRLFDLLQTYTPDIEIASIDECYLDYGKVKMLYGPEVDFAYALKDKIEKELKFTVNIGIGENKLCAKMASDFEKPNKVHTLYRNEIEEKMFPLPVGELFGIGKKTVPKLNQIGIFTIKDLATINEIKLKRHFKNQANYMIQIANGIRYDEVDSIKHTNTSISHETTLTKDTSDKEILYKELFKLSVMVGRRVRLQKEYATVICVVIKTCFFKKISHQKKLKNGTNISSEIFHFSKEILDEFYDSTPVRLIGIRLDGLEKDRTYQTSLFEKPVYRDKELKIDLVVDDINTKYGELIVKRASLFNKKSKL